MDEDKGWFAFGPRGERPSGQPDDGSDLPEIIGTEIRMMGEYCCAMPLWTLGGPLEAPHDWLTTQLGLSPGLLADLETWGREWDEVNSRSVADDTVPVKPLPPGWYDDHDRRGRELHRRVVAEIDPRYTVRYIN